MVSVTQQTIATGASLGHVTRPARALIGWMQQAEAQLTLAQRLIHLADHQSHIDQATMARQAVEARAPLIDQSNILSDITPGSNRPCN